MAKCEACGKSTAFGHNRSFSLRATRRTFRPNLQKVTTYENGTRIQRTLCTKCIRTLSKISKK
ncbi:MAG: 50S ribosomal protein L28 [Chloroflexi bacterium]|nr:50S ribosomal protein L28 [Chloroflexota bacterium]